MIGIMNYKFSSFFLKKLFILNFLKILRNVFETGTVAEEVGIYILAREVTYIINIKTIITINIIIMTVIIYGRNRIY